MHTSTVESASKDPLRRGRVIVFGDSHIHAIKDALEQRKLEGTSIPIEARRLFKVKKIAEPADNSPRRLVPRLSGWARRALKLGSTTGEAITLGDISFERALKLARGLGPNDILVSVIGGNQHAVFGTIQHPLPFDFELPEEAGRHSTGAELIPFRTFHDYFQSWIREGDGATISTFRRSTAAKVIHLLAPPPKQDNSWIEQHHDTFFASEGISRFGVSKPELRFKFWKLQNRVMQQICAELDVEVMGPPNEACDPDGFLARDFYAGDATHANPRYGELVLRQLEARFEHHVGPAKMES